MFTNGSTAMECGGGLKALAEAACEAVPGSAAATSAPSFDGTKRFATKYPSPKTTTAVSTRSVAFARQEARMDFRVCDASDTPAASAGVLADSWDSSPDSR